MKDIDFTGKVAVITGADSGMGLMAAREFARLGAKVVMCDLDETRLSQESELLKSGGVEALACAGDVRKFAHVEEAAKIAASLGGCDILVTCAGGDERNADCARPRCRNA